MTPGLYWAQVTSGVGACAMPAVEAFRAVRIPEIIQTAAAR